MTEVTAAAVPRNPNNDSHDISYCCGRSSFGDFLAAVDDKGLCAVLLGDDQAGLLQDLQRAFPNRTLVPCDRPGCCDFLMNAVARLIEQPAASTAFPISVCGGDFKQMVHAALRRTRPGTTITPEEIAGMIGAAGESAEHVRACAAEDLLAVVAPFHRLQERDGMSPAYRWGEERRQVLLKREGAVSRPDVSGHG